MDGVIGRPVRTEPFDKGNSSNCIRGRALPWSPFHLFGAGGSHLSSDALCTLQGCNALYIRCLVNTLRSKFKLYKIPTFFPGTTRTPGYNRENLMKAKIEGGSQAR